jgi:transposase-like protein
MARQARQELRGAIRAALDNGETIAAVARAIDVSRQRVYQILGR